ncbi:cytochrome P450 315a1, mitochondrial [Phlebotomus argentipes]|uniref:cytochrome P450 315a1, mitochondrial n=1 Tax=Phlebotomus argentipes TaxID=94469 RepID=UPI002892ADD1|nr:cytochrome P450 315a1, mitochondrial [Phlebotomus argentipes]
MFRLSSFGFVRKMCSFATNGKKILDFSDIPAAKGLPFIGTTLDIMKAGSAPKFHEYIEKRHEDLGAIFRERIGSLDCLFISDPELIREIFLHEGKYPRHVIPDVWKLYQRKHENKRGLLFMDGEEWLHHRKIMNSLLLTRDFAAFSNPIRDSAERLVGKWRSEETGKPIESLESDLYRWSLETITNLMVGSSYQQLRPEIEESLERLSRVLHRIFQTSARLFIAPAQICKFFGTRSWREFEDSVTETLSIGGDIITKFLNNRDLHDGILAEMMTREIPRDYIERIMVDLIIAAGDTTSFSTLWCLHMLAKHTDEQESLRREIEGRESLAADEIPALKATVRETLRLFPVAPFVGRIVGGNGTILGNYRIDREIMAIVSLFTSSRDPRNFHEPQKFNPKRWIRSQDSTEHKRQASLPFALGARSCIGQRIAMKQMCELLRQILLKFHLDDHSGHVIPILQLITVPDKKIKITFRKI